MKAKHITKLRKKARLMEVYKIRECWGLFGFNTLNQHDFEEIKANSIYNALQKFFKSYSQTAKKKHRFYSCNTETTWNWGRIEVIDEKGNKTYYN